MSVADISVHESVWPSRRRTSLIDCLRRRSLDARFHYESPAQTGAWLALHEAHSPARSDPAVARLYPDAIGGCLSRMPAPARLASLGCGGGQKDLDVLCACGASAYAAIDVAPGMVIEAINRVRAHLPSVAASGLVADLHAIQAIAAWTRGAFRPKGPTLWLAFGIVPNIPANEIPGFLRALLTHPEDRLLLGANLIPGSNPQAEMGDLLPQYDNETTRRWLVLLPQSLGIPAAPEDIRFAVIPPDGALPWRIEATLPIRSNCQISIHGECLHLHAAEPLRLFFSNRFTPDEIRNMASAAGCQIAASRIAPSREEGVFEVHR